MGNSCYCDYDVASFYRAARPLARKAHRCHECRRMIQPGERYESVAGVWDGEMSTCKTCVYCLAARDLMMAFSRCFCWEHGNMLENLADELHNSGYRVPGLSMAVGRLLVEGRRAKKEEMAW